MADMLHHSMSSAKKFKAEPEDFFFIHALMDSSKLFLSDWRHRFLMHSTWGLHVMETYIVGRYFTAQDGRKLPTREVVEQHILEDTNAILTPAEWLHLLPAETVRNTLEKRKLNYLNWSTPSQANSSAINFGGAPEDYLHIHSFLDSPEYFLQDERALITTHSSFGIYLADQAFGKVITRKSDGVTVPTQRIVRQHIKAKLTEIPDVSIFLKLLPLRQWMNGLKPEQVRRIQQLTLDQENTLESS